MKTLKELKKEYEVLEDIKSFEDLKDLASNFIRMVTWKKEKDLQYIKDNYYDIFVDIIKDIKNKTYNVAMIEVKNGDLHKAYNIKYLYAYYNKNYDELKNIKKENKKNIMEGL